MIGERYERGVLYKKFRSDFAECFLLIIEKFNFLFVSLLRLFVTFLVVLVAEETGSYYALEICFENYVDYGRYL